MQMQARMQGETCSKDNSLPLDHNEPCEDDYCPIVGQL